MKLAGKKELHDCASTNSIWTLKGVRGVERAGRDAGDAGEGKIFVVQPRNG